MEILLDFVVLVFELEILHKDIAFHSKFDIKNCIVFRLLLTVWRAGLAIIFGTGRAGRPYTLRIWFGPAYIEAFPYFTEIEVGRWFHYKRQPFIGRTHSRIDFRGKKWEWEKKDPLPRNSKA